MVMYKKIVALVGFISLTILPFAHAHHGFEGYFDPNKVIKIEGKVKRFEFINPHGYLHIETVDKDGKPIVYVCDLQARNQLARNGVDKNFFKVGQPIVVMAFQARRDPYGCEFGVGYFADGSSFTMRNIDKAQTEFAADMVVADAAATKTIFNSWIRANLYGAAGGQGRTTGRDSITAAGKAAAAAFDPSKDNPVLHCKGGSPIRNWGAPGLVTVISRKGDKVTIQHETMDITRTVHMNMKTHPKGVKPSDMGHSIGRFEGETLVIDTAHFTAGVLSGETMHSDQLTLQERISLNKENGDLMIAWQANDPLYFSEPLKGSQSLKRTAKKILPYGCVPDTHAR
jgi:hypothetical protein